MYKNILLVLIPLLVFIGCEGPEGPAGPAGVDGVDGVDGAVGPAGEVSEIIITIGTKHYTEGNPSWITVHYDNDETNANTSVLFASYKNTNDVWTNIEVYDSYFAATIYTNGGEYSYDNKVGYAALIWDPDQDLLGVELKLLYIP